jgi:hypothetical protein
MPKDIEVTDPRGFVIRCSGKYWQNHVLVKHLDLENCEIFAERALRSPKYNCIFSSKSHPHRHIYYGELRNRVEIKVVVEFSNSNEGIVVSVSSVSNRPNGEILLWRKE